MWVKNITDFGGFCYLNIPCLRINITLICMSSPSERCMTFADCRLQTADRRPHTTDRRPQTADRRPQTADRRPQTVDRRPQTADCYLCDTNYKIIHIENIQIKLTSSSIK